MARLALVDASEGTVTAVRAVAGPHSLVVTRRGSVPIDVDLVIVDVRGSDLPGAGDLGSAATPLLLLVDAGATIDASAYGERPIAILQKPFELIDLRAEVRRMLESSAATAGLSATTAVVTAALSATAATGRDKLSILPSVGATEPWSGLPMLAPAAAAVLSAAHRLGGAVWIVGEDGTGTDRVAAALALAWDGGREPIVWQEGEAVSSAIARLGDGQRVLWIPGVDERPMREQRSFERFLAVDSGRRVVVTSLDDPGEAVAAGTLSRSLHRALSAVSLRLAPLRERPADIAPLATAVGARVAAAALGAEDFTLTGDARRTLETYPWPGNFAELEAVVTRSVIASPPGRAVVLDSAQLLFAAALWPSPSSAIVEEMALASRRAVVLPLDAGRVVAPMEAARVVAPMEAARAVGSLDAARAGFPLTAARTVRPSDLTSAMAGQVPENTTPDEQLRALRSGAADAAGVEAVLAAFAHDIRNPMSTIKTFAGLQAATASDDQSELARLAVDACERVDEHLGFLQRYAELAPATATRVDLVDILGDAVDAGGEPGALGILARAPVWTHADAALVRFVADAIVAECRSRMATGATADVAAGGSAIEIRIPVGGAAVDRLGKWVEGASLPWRLALAREAARRSGGDLQLDSQDGEMRLEWRLPRAAEEGSNDDQAGSPDRRRRSRSS